MERVHSCLKLISRELPHRWNCTGPVPEKNIDAVLRWFASLPRKSTDSGLTADQSFARSGLNILYQQLSKLGIDCNGLLWKLPVWSAPIWKWKTIWLTVTLFGMASYASPKIPPKRCSLTRQPINGTEVNIFPSPVTFTTTTLNINTQKGIVRGPEKIEAKHALLCEAHALPFFPPLAWILTRWCITFNQLQLMLVMVDRKDSFVPFPLFFEELFIPHFHIW